MIDPMVLAAFVIAVAVLTMTPGPDMLLILAVGARGGSRVGVAAAFGVAAGLAVHAAAAAFGLAALFRLVPVAYDAVRIAGAAYLLYLGIRTLRERNADDFAAAPGRCAGWTVRRAFSRGMLCNLLNPKVVLFNAAFLPQFVDPARGSTTTQLLLLGAVFVVVDLLIDGPIGLLAGRLNGWLVRHRQARRGLRVGVGSLFVGLSVRLALDGR